MALMIETPGSFSLSAVIRSHGWAGLAPFQADEEKRELQYIDRLASGKVVRLVIRQQGQAVEVNVDPDVDPYEQAEIEDRVAWMLGLEQDLSDFYDLAGEEPKLAHVVERARGRILRSPTLFEDAVKTILTTNTAWSGTVRMAASIVGEFGVPWPGDPARHAFPGPGRLSAASEDELRAAGLGYRAPYVQKLAAVVNAGELDLEALKTSDLPTDVLRKKLLTITGIGDYAAANLLMILEHYDYIPVDSWARRMVSEEWYEGEPVGKREVLHAFEKWGQWKGLAYWFWDWSSYDA